jgi:hypothetical protein
MAGRAKNKTNKELAVNILNTSVLVTMMPISPIIWSDLFQRWPP